MLDALGYWVNLNATEPDVSLRHALTAFQKIADRPRTGVLTQAELQALRQALWGSRCPHFATTTGVLEDQTLLAVGAPTARTRTTCPYCGTGCEMEVGTRANRIVTIKPALDGPVNKGHLCVKGRYGFEFVYANDRITAPLIRVQGEWRRVSWDEAIAFAAERLQQIRAQCGADSLGVLGSARATNEENYLAQKFARVVLGTNNVDCCARDCHAPRAAAMKLTLGTGAATNSFDDIELCALTWRKSACLRRHDRSAAAPERRHRPAARPVRHPNQKLQAGQRPDRS